MSYKVAVVGATGNVGREMLEMGRILSFLHLAVRYRQNIHQKRRRRAQS